MKALALGTLADLRRRRLLPIAVLLLAVVIALPVVALKPSEEPAPATPPATASVANQTVDGLPSPQQALDGNDKPLVSLAVLNEASDLDEFGSKNPFKPMDDLAKSNGDAPTSVAPGTGTGATATADTGSGGTSDSTGGGGSTPKATPDTPTTTTPKSDAPKTDEKPKAEKKLTYALDLTFTTPKGKRSYRNVSRLRMLPSQANPLFIYLGPDATAAKAVFLVDSSLTIAGGEGVCSPSNKSCATVALEPGEIANFTDGQGGVYELQVDQLREVTTASVSKAARAARLRRGNAQASVGNTRRFVPPIITDLFVGQGR